MILKCDKCGNSCASQKQWRGQLARRQASRQARAAPVLPSPPAMVLELCSPSSACQAGKPGQRPASSTVSTAPQPLFSTVNPEMGSPNLLDCAVMQRWAAIGAVGSPARQHEVCGTLLPAQRVAEAPTQQHNKLLNGVALDCRRQQGTSMHWLQQAHFRVTLGKHTQRKHTCGEHIHDKHNHGKHTEASILSRYACQHQLLKRCTARCKHGAAHFPTSLRSCQTRLQRALLTKVGP